MSFEKRGKKVHELEMNPRASGLFICMSCISVFDVVTKPLLLPPYHPGSNARCSSAPNLEQCENVEQSPTVGVHLLQLRVKSVLRNLFCVEKNAVSSEGKSSASLHEDFQDIFFPPKHKHIPLLKALLLIQHVTVAFHQEKAVFTVKRLHSEA